MNHLLRLLLLTHPAHETAIYRLRERESKMTEQRQRGLETNIITEQRREKDKDLRDERETKKEWEWNLWW